MNDKPTLSIVIPTHKRPNLLKRCLASFVETSSFPAKLCVFDNASGDETTSVLEIMTSILPHLTYAKSGSLYEAETSVMKSIEMSVDSDYIWFFGDDDALIPGSFDYIYNSLLLSPDFVYLPFSDYYDYHKSPFSYGLDISQKIAEESEKFDCFNLITHPIMHIPRQGSFICRSDLFMDSKFPLSLFRETAFVYAGAIVALINQSKMQKVKVSSIGFPTWISEDRNPKLWASEFDTYKLKFFCFPLFYSIIAGKGLWTKKLDWQVKNILLNYEPTLSLSSNFTIPLAKRIFKDPRFSSSYQAFMVNLAKKSKQNEPISLDEMAELISPITLSH
jgi:glycosyltransferase involved in cell wall biosynthesis